MSSTLDGSDAIDIRMNSQTSQFSNVKSIAYHDSLFYWTNGKEIFAEEYHQTEDMFYHNAYLLRNGPFSDINIHHHHHQPDPVPLNAVETVQAIFTDSKVKIRWTKPRVLGGLGKGAWQKWLYEVHLRDMNTGLNIYERNITKNKYALDNLAPNTTYSIKIRAYGPGGRGPWSADFVGRTLKSDNFPYNPFILLSAREGLLKSDVIGDNVQHLIPKIYLNNAHITGISWYDGLIFLNTNSSSVYVYNMNGSLSRMSNITNAAAIAIDWMAPKIYWSSPVQQMISRANLDGSQPEPLPIPTMAKQLAIDSLKGYIYWATSHSIECARLNGDGHFTYMKNELFSGKHVMGLTLDFDKGEVYWIVRSHEGSLMYRASLANDNSNEEFEIAFDFMGPLPEDDVRGPMWYFNDRLFWLHEHKGVLLSDMNGHNIASIHGPGLSGLKTLAIIDPSLQPFPDGFDQDGVRVVPTSVVDSTIRTEGTWDCFNVTWEPVESTNYGPLFYEMKVDDGSEIFTLVTDEPVFSYPTIRQLQPYSPLTVAVKPFTYWASSRQTVVMIYSPMSIPTKPLEPRIFIAYKSSLSSVNKNIQGIFRWLPPSSPNGIILGYQVTYWLNTNESEEVREDIYRPKLEFYANNLKPNATYNFKVQAFTKVGFGQHSEIVQAQTFEEHPVPQLVITKSDAVKITDIDTHEQKLLSNKVSHPAAVAYLAHEGKIFWIEEDGSLMSSLLDGANVTLIRHLTSRVKSLTVDWIGRVLYWSQIEKSKDHSSIWSLDLSHDSLPHLILFNYSGIITSLEAEPFTSSLLWIVKKRMHCELMISNNKGMHVKSFFWMPMNHATSSNLKDKRRKAENDVLCNCSEMHMFGRTITVDTTNTSRTQVLYADGKHGHIWSSDLEGCTCQLVVNASELTRHNGLPPTSLAIDSSRIYWTNETLGKLFSVAREKVLVKEALPYANIEMPHLPSHRKHHVMSEDIRGIRSIRAIGNHLQPFPDPVCLSPLPYKETAKLMSRSPTSLTLYFPSAERPDICKKISMASVMYTVHYKYVDAGDSVTSDKSYIVCSEGDKQDNFCKIQTKNNTVVIHGLQPFSNYSIQIEASNYYNRRKTGPGPEVVFQTREGAPTAPTNVSAHVITPFRIDVFWQPPLFPNGHPIQYEVRWRTENLHRNGRSEVYVQQLEKSENMFVMSINTNEPGTLHYIRVRAYSSGGDMHNDSREISVTTYNLPSNLTLNEATHDFISLTWQSPDDNSIFHHSLEYSEVEAFVWHLAEKSQRTTPSTLYEFLVFELRSKTRYNFRLLLTYFAKNVTIEWPYDHYFLFETLGGPPSLPGQPQVRHVNNNVYQVYWDEASENDGEYILYELQMKSKDETYSDWVRVYNNSNSQWFIESISANVNYEFRVRAANEFGNSNFSLSSASFFLPEAGAFVDNDEDQVGIITASAVATLILLSIFLAVVFMVHRRQEKEKKILHDIVNQNQLSPELELATLQELPRHGNFVHQTNALYNLGDLPVDEELLALPQIQRNQIILTKFLGSGAFGEVFEGIAHDFVEGLPPMKVAIKTLRKGATEHEKEEFLKEAKLMSNFKHDHILRLLGVCFDNNPNFIILELMEGGDLLSYLRSNRPSIFERSSLMLDDLFGICVDVALGCKYLEDMHFVHRDLAARNCLVSSYDTEHRIVKIGDFGLARDIYKNDYYRKEGEGLLPVRWMAPESLVDGIFTSQTDIWAFGVLLWEVMTLGQQPYPARTNIEVFHYVRAGGRLDKPDNCPDDLHQVMISCWSYDPDGRPSFSYCLNALQELRRKAMISPSALTAVQNQNYLSDSTLDGYIIANDELNERKNPAEQDDDNFSTHSDPIRSSALVTHTVKRSVSLTHHSRPRAMPETDFPSIAATVNRNAFNFGRNRNKYLELLGDNEDADGYEIPLRPTNIPNDGFASKPNSFSSKRALPSTPDNNIKRESSKVMPKLLLSPSYAQALSAWPKSAKGNTFISECSNSHHGENCDELSEKNQHKSHVYCQNHLDEACSYENDEECQSSAKIANTSLLTFNVGNFSEEDREKDGSASENSSCSENDHWSISTASTVQCDSNYSPKSLRNSGISKLSSVSAINLHVSNSSWC